MKDEVYLLHRDLEDSHWWFVGRRRILFPLIREALRACEDDLIVDVGCGTGGTVKPLSRDFKCLGIDHSQPAIDMARAKYPGCDFICGKMPDDLRDTADQTALYMLMDVLEHIEDDRAFLADVVSLMRPGGHVLITVPASPTLWSGHDVAAGHYRRFEMDTLVDLWQELPLRPRVVTYFNTRLFPIIWTVRVIGKRLGLFAGKEESDFSMPPLILNTLLNRIFAGEKDRISRLLDDPSAKPYATGVSLLALLQRTG